MPPSDDGVNASETVASKWMAMGRVEGGGNKDARPDCDETVMS